MPAKRPSNSDAPKARRRLTLPSPAVPGEGSANAAKLPARFYQRDATPVAQDLVGTILVHRFANRKYRARIVETEAYVGAHDLACHVGSSRVDLQACKLEYSIVSPK